MHDLAKVLAVFIGLTIQTIITIREEINQSIAGISIRECHVNLAINVSSLKDANTAIHPPMVFTIAKNC